MFVCRVACYVEPAQVGLGDIPSVLEIGVDDTKDLEHVATHRNTLMTGDAAVSLE